MTKLLQKKFIFTAMIAITILILLMLGTINIANIVAMKNDTDIRLHMISENYGKSMNMRKKLRDMPKLNNEIHPRLEWDRIQASPFFVLNCDLDGNITYVDSSRIPSLTADDEKSYIEEVLSQNKDTGKVGNYKYLINQNENLSEKSIVFLDTSDEFYLYIRVLGLSIIIGFVCWVCMFVIVILLSKKAIKPIAENIEKQKQFITNAGHEIKTPLAIIQTNTEALELYQGESKWSNNIKQQTIRLNDLMKNLLQLSRMDENNIAVKQEEVNLYNLLLREITFFEEIFAQNNLSIKQELVDNIEIIRGNKEQITQMIAILLDNASKYAKRDSVVSISMIKTSRHIKIMIENECDELPSKEPNRLFDRFYRADKARTQKTGGYGIGLSLAKAIAEANKYSLDCSYPMENKIKFTIQFRY